MYLCAHVLLCPHTIVPMHCGAHKPVKILSENVPFCWPVIVPTNRCTQQWKPHMPMCPHTIVPMYPYQDQRSRWPKLGYSNLYWDQRSRCPELGHSDPYWGQRSTWPKKKPWLITSHNDCNYVVVTLCWGQRSQLPGPNLGHCDPWLDTSHNTVWVTGMLDLDVCHHDPIWVTVTWFNESLWPNLGHLNFDLQWPN